MIRTITEKLVYENAYVRIYDDDVAFPDGHQGTYYHSRWKAPYGVGVVPVIGNHVLLIRTYRYGERRYSLEIPQGFGTDGSTPQVDALRELQEETGLIADHLVSLFTAGHDYATHVFRADFAEGLTPTAAHTEATEDISGFVFVDRAEINLANFATLGIFEPVTMIALLAMAQPGPA